MSRALSNRTLAVAANEVRHLARSRVAITGLGLVALLTLSSAVTSGAYHADQGALRDRLQEAANTDFESQPDRHPHRVVHAGHFAVRPASGLAAMDPGVEAFTGAMVFLEGHRQNSANFGDARQSSLLVRFGQLSPAFVLQVVAPLLLIFIGAGAMAREREQGTLRQAILAGVSGVEVMAGKALALGAAVLVIAAPAVVLLAYLSLVGPATGSAVAMTLVGYGFYLACWVMLVVAASALALRNRTALIALVGVWTFSVILTPRIAPEAAAVRPLPTRIETDIAIQRDLRALGDSHNPDDPYFAAFKQRTLARYGVARVEDLPVNYRGLVGMEGEKLTSGLFNRYAEQAFSAMETQSGVMDAFAVLSPTVALRRLSMSAAETDLASYRRFLEQTEAYRYDLIQRLNRLQAEAVDAHDDAAKGDDAAAEARSRVSASNWHEMPRFQPTRPGAVEVLSRATPALAALILWLALASALAAWAANRLTRSA